MGGSRISCAGTWQKIHGYAHSRRHVLCIRHSLNLLMLLDICFFSIAIHVLAIINLHAWLECMCLYSLAVPPLRLEEEGSGDTHILNPFCRSYRCSG